ncbi:MAG: histidine phosphatase family protein [Oscillospiraceae bacterium]|nr:histidine phosphatase family protein [Oscillospiraceae bacterium]
MKLYVTRHGETEWNALDQICGITDIALAPAGIAQAQQLAEECAKAGDIQRIIASPMKRAQMTAGFVAERLSLPVQTDERLREWDYGSFEGKPRLTEGFSDAKAAWGCKMPDGGESVFQIVQRAYNVIDDVKRLYPDENVLLVCHGGICRVIDSYFYDMTTERFMGFFMGNCELRVYEL